LFELLEILWKLLVKILFSCNHHKMLIKAVYVRKITFGGGRSYRLSRQSSFLA
jgi:hypothetical protein